MDIQLFGPLTIEDGSRKLGPAELGGRKPEQILEILLTDRGHVVSKDRIADLLWPEGGPESPARAIDTYVSVLRRRLEPSMARATLRRGPPFEEHPSSGSISPSTW